jgi:hypothetical protein
MKEPPVIKTRIIIINGPEPARPSQRPSRTLSLPPQQWPLVLGLLRRGETKRVKLFLFKKEEDIGRRPTINHLDIHVTCHEPERSYYLDIEGFFGRNTPQTAVLTAITGRNEQTSPVCLVRDGRSQGKVGLALETGPAVERIVLLVRIEGSNKLPKKLLAIMHNRPRPISGT